MTDETTFLSTEPLSAARTSSGWRNGGRRRRDAGRGSASGALMRRHMPRVPPAPSTGGPPASGPTGTRWSGPTMRAATTCGSCQPRGRGGDDSTPARPGGDADPAQPARRRRQRHQPQSPRRSSTRCGPTPCPPCTSPGRSGPATSPRWPRSAHPDRAAVVRGRVRRSRSVPVTRWVHVVERGEPDPGRAGLRGARPPAGRVARRRGAAVLRAGRVHGGVAAEVRARRPHPGAVRTAAEMRRILWHEGERSRVGGSRTRSACGRSRRSRERRWTASPSSGASSRSRSTPRRRTR